MTTTLHAPARARPVPPPPSPSRSWAAGLRAALVAAVLGLLVVVVPGLLVWGTDDRSSAGALDAVRALSQLWLLAHGASLHLGDGTIGLVPLGLSAVPFLLLARTCSTAARQCLTADLRHGVGLAVCVALPYTAVATGVAAFTVLPGAHAALLQTATSVLALSLPAALCGALRPAGLHRVLWHRCPVAVRRDLRAAAVAGGVLAAGGSLLAGGALAVHLPAVVDRSQTLAPGPVGALVLALVGLALVPNAVVLGVAWLSGAGFVVGTGTSVTPTAVELGQLPPLPVLAALPQGGAPTWVAVLSLGLPVLAGALAARLLARASATSPGRATLDAVRLGVLTGAGAAGLLWVAGGPLGGARLSEVGAPVARTAVLLSLEVAVGALLAGVLRWLVVRRRSAQRPAVSA